MTETALTFNGIIPLIPDILIDNFELLHENENQENLKIKYCFISHAHSDHYKGLSKQIHLKKTPQFIMTKTTKELIISHSNTNLSLKRNLSNLIFIKLNIPIEIESGLKITFIPNYHCLGSAMILIEDRRNVNNKVNILFSGDARFENSVIYSIRTSTNLLPYLFGDSKIDLLYLDTTFSYRNRNIEIPENLQGIYQLKKLIEKYPIGTNFRFLDTTYGFEEVWCKIYDFFKSDCNFFISKKILKWIKELQLNNDFEYYDLEKNVNVIDKIHKLKPILHVNFKYTFYIGDIKEFQIDNSELIVNIKHAIDLTKEEFENIYLPKRECEFEEIIPNKNIWDGKFWFQSGNQKHLLNFSFMKDDNNNIFLPLHIKFIYSRHSSFSETKNFLKIFKGTIKDIYPMTESFHTWQRGFNMKNFFGVENSYYDEISKEKYGSCNLTLKNCESNIETIDYWRLVDDDHYNTDDDDDDFINKINNNNINDVSFNSVSTEADFNFIPIGQDLRKVSKTDNSFDERKRFLLEFRGKLFQTQKREKRKRIDRFLPNIDVLDNDNHEVQVVELNCIEETDNIHGTGDNETAKFKKKKVMSLTSNLKDILTDINFM